MSGSCQANMLHMVYDIDSKETDKGPGKGQAKKE
jgi:hypothetical protein